MSHIPRENKMHPNIKILRLTSPLKEKKTALLATYFEKYTQFGWDRLCYNLSRSDFLVTCDLLPFTWNLTWALKSENCENYVQTGLFLQQPVQNVSQKQRKYTILCSIPKFTKTREVFLFIYFWQVYNEIHFGTQLKVENIKMLQRCEIETAAELCNLSADDSWHTRWFGLAY